VAYRADIEIAVRGAQELKRLQNEVSATSKLVDTLNNYLENIGSGGIVRSINNLRDIVSQAATAFNNAALNTEEATIAATKYVRATEELNSGLRERALLLKQITEQERKAKLAASGIRETTQYRGPIGPGPASAVGTLAGQKSPVAERVQRIIQSKQDEAALQAALLRLEEKSAAVLNEKVQSQQNLVRGTQEVYELLARQQQRASFLAGKSGTLMQGPLAGAGAMGFPVALPMTAAEQEGLRTAAQKQQILQRMAATRQQLIGLAANLQRLDQNSAVAIADAKRAQESLNLARERELQIAKEVSAIRSREGAASVAARQRLASEAARRQLIQNAGFGVQGPALPPTAAVAASRSGGGVGGRIGGAISGSIIGGAFPLLFGQSGGAAAGGAIGGLVGGLAGPGGSFAGSLLGTLLGEIASKGQAIKQLGDDIGFSTQQTKQLSDAFKVANTDVDKFTAVIQNIRGVGLALEDQAKAIQLVTRLTEAYGGSFEKTGNSITSALESGKVTQATLNQLTSQGINIQQALADKYKVSRSEILKMAKDGEISVQSLIDTLVEVANAGTAGATKVRSSYEETATAMTNAFANATTGINTSFTNTQNTVVTAFDRIVKAMSPALIKLAEITGKVISLGAYIVELGVKFATAFYSIPGTIQAVGTAISNMIPGLNAIYWTLSSIDKLRGGGSENRGGLATSLNLNAGMDGANWPAGIPRPGTPVQSFTVPSELGPTGGAAKKGPKPPESRVAQLKAEYEALLLIGNQENAIRDYVFKGQEILAANAELATKVAVIERERVQALDKANYAAEKELINKIAQAKELYAIAENEDKIREIKQRQFEYDLASQKAIRDAVQPFTELTKQQELQSQYSKTYLRLVTEGMLPAEAERIANFEQLVIKQTDAITEQVKLTEAAILEAKARGASTAELEKQLKSLKDQQKAIADAASQGPGKGKTGTERSQDAIATARGELNELVNIENQVIAGAKAIGDAFQQAFKGLVSGAMTGREALAAFFKSVGDHFLDMASKMIAKLIEIYILETVIGFISGAVSSGFTSKSNAAGKATFGGSFKGTGSSTFGSGGIRVPGYAEGGFVTGPTRALIGEGGEPEYVIPRSKMSAAMSRYSRGARGEAVVFGNGIGGGSGGTATSAMEPIDVRYSVERINNVDYVTADQFRAGMAQAAQQGAIQGERRAMRSLKNSAATRRGVGI
jgi:tape measure domain-containing protein